MKIAVRARVAGAMERQAVDTVVMNTGQPTVLPRSGFSAIVRLALQLVGRQHWQGDRNADRQLSTEGESESRRHAAGPPRRSQAAVVGAPNASNVG